MNYLIHLTTSHKSVSRKIQFPKGKNTMFGCRLLREYKYVNTFFCWWMNDVVVGMKIEKE